MIFNDLTNKNLIKDAPRWLKDNICYLTMMGSVAYGVSSDSSDIDVYGFCMPPKSILFPHLAGYIPDFGTPPPKFEQYIEHHIYDKDADKQYDFQIFSIVKYFNLTMKCNPNMIDSLYTPNFCVMHATKVGNIVRENRNLFLNKSAWTTFKNYAYSQLNKIKNKNHKRLEELISFENQNDISNKTKFIEVKNELDNPSILTEKLGQEKIHQYIKLYEEVISESGRAENVKIMGFDVKFAYHVVRLLYEVEQILNEQDIDLLRNKEHLKAIRRGDISEKEIREWASEKEKYLEKCYENSKLREKCDEEKLKTILLNCLEEHYGNLEKTIISQNAAIMALKEINAILENNRNLLT